VRLGVGLSNGVAAWGRGDLGPLEHILESTVGEKSAAHAARTAALAHTLAEPLTLSPQDVSDIVLAALVHPLGAAGKSVDTTCPADQGSASRALRLVASIPSAAGASDVLRHFDERWDGTGPLGLSGEQILLGARLLAAIEAFDRTSVAGLEPAIAEIRSGSGSAFDPVVAAEIIHLFRTNPALAAA
jgi:response regulator RpfG family c-di-GMP phosphodiesterase